MTSPAWENTQLAFYLKELGAVPGTTRGNAVAATPWWRAYPDMYSTANNYAGMSVAPNRKAQRTADRTAGDRVFDAGFGGISN